MRKIIYIFFVMICSMHVDAMMNKLKIRRSRSYCYERPKIQKSQGPFTPVFSKEIDKNILGLVITNTGQTLQEAAEIFSALICVNKFTHMYMDDDQRVLGWIKDFSKRFDCADLDVAETLCTRIAKYRFVVQSNFHLNWTYGDRSEYRAKDLKKAGLDVNFSYDKNYPSPLLQCCVGSGRSDAARWLIKNGADINVCTSEGNNACMLALWMKNTFFINQLVRHKDFKPNHQNNNSETALHCYLNLIVKEPLRDETSVMCNIVNNMLAKGANPILADDKGITPLKIAKDIKKEILRQEIVQLLEKAAIKFGFSENIK